MKTSKIYSLKEIEVQIGNYSYSAHIYKYNNVSGKFIVQ